MTINDTNISGEKSPNESTGERNRGFGLTLIILAIIVLSALAPINDIYEGFYVNNQINALVLGLITNTFAIFESVISQATRCVIFKANLVSN